MNGNLTQTGGILAPGDSPGITTITGDYNLNAGSLDMELAGFITQGVDYDFVDITGAFNIGAADLNVTLFGGYVPLTGHSYNLFDFASLTGTFDNINLPTLTAGLSWDTTQLYSNGILSVTGSAAVPEPTTNLALALGLCGFAWWRRRRGHSAQTFS